MIMNKDKVREQWKEPGSAWRSFPFWAWNDEMDPEEIRRQIRLMKEAGIGGFFIHSREGLETEYLGTRWMECVRAAAEEAKEQGMYAWLYDEDRFPSGTAGGRVTAAGDAFRCKGLTLEVLKPEEYPQIYKEEIGGRNSFSDEENGFLAAYAASVREDELIRCRRLELKEKEVFSEDEMLLAVRLEVSAPSEWFNHEAPPDNLNPDCVRFFIQQTHEAYKAELGDEFGKTVPGIFTDEPSLHDRHAYFGEKRSWIPWTYGYGAYFQKQKGYDFLDLLPWFYFNGSLSKKARRDYWHSIALRFGSAYFKTIGDWCGGNNLLFTGHFLQEDKLGLGVRVNGAIMPGYQYFQMPGIDMLCEQTGEYLTVKQCTSVARQLGKKRVLTETYGCTGWDFDFEGQKWMGDWQYVLGVNCRCQHMALYSLRGCRKRDYPPSFNYHTAWWKDYRYIEDYFARLSMVLTEGEAVCRILLLHPLSSVWSRLGASPYGNSVRRRERDVPALNAYGQELNRLIEYLERIHLDLDLGDEILMDQYGEARDGKLQIGRSVYETVVIPPGMDSMLDSTSLLLDEFRKQGGTVIQMEEYSDRVFLELAAGLEPFRQLRIQNGEGEECREVLYQLRKTEEGYVLFLVNNNRKKALDVKVSLPFYAEAQELDPFEGEITSAGTVNRAEGTEFSVHLEPVGSALYRLSSLTVYSTEIKEGETFRLDQPNVLPLDMCRYRLDEGEWSDLMEIWMAGRELRSRLGMRPVWHNGLEQRYRWTHTPHREDGHRLELEFSFYSCQDLSEVCLSAERLEEFEVTLNGQPVPVVKQGWFLDQAFETMVLGTVRKGENRLKLACSYRNSMELENLYLSGTFGVTQDRRLTVFPRELVFGDWRMQGLLHYCGSVVWSFSYKKSDESRETLWVLPEIRGVCTRLRINGHEKLLIRGCQEIRGIDRYLHSGINRIEIEVTSSPRNMMGPFHLKEKPYNTHDASFCPEQEEYSSDYLTEPYGIMGAVRVLEIQKQ